MHVCLRKRWSRFQFCPHQIPSWWTTCIWRTFNIGQDSLHISPISQSQAGPISVYRDLFDLYSRGPIVPTLAAWSRSLTKMLLTLSFGQWKQVKSCYWSHISLRFSWDAYKVGEKNGHRIYCGLPKFLILMADSDDSSPDFSPDVSVTVSPAESIKEQFDPCATTTDVPINATSTSVGLEEPDSHHHNLSTLRLLFAHIGYVNFIYYVHISWPIHSAALTLFLATTDAVREYQIFLHVFVSSIFIDNCLHESSNNCQWPTRISSSIHMGRRFVYADPDCLSTPVWKSLWLSGTKGLLVLLLLYMVIIILSLQNVLYFSLAIFALGSALCGAAQVSLSFSQSLIY